MQRHKPQNKHVAKQLYDIKRNRSSSSSSSSNGTPRTSWVKHSSALAGVLQAGRGLERQAALVLAPTQPKVQASNSDKWRAQQLRGCDGRRMQTS